MKSLSHDTSSEAQELIFELLRTAPASKKIALMFDLIQTTRLLVLAGLHRRFPNASDEEIRHRLISKLLKREDVIRAFGFDPRAEGH